MRTQTLNDNTEASYPGGLRLSPRKLAILDPELVPELAKWRLFRRRKTLTSELAFWRTHCEEHLVHGDTRAALVMSLNPLLVAAYTDEMDCVAMIKFPVQFVQQYRLEVGTRMVTVNTYSTGKHPVRDLENGPEASFLYNNFAPYIAEFYSDDFDKIEARKQSIDEAEWRRTLEMGRRYLRDKPGRYRGGGPRECRLPA